MIARSTISEYGEPMTSRVVRTLVAATGVVVLSAFRQDPQGLQRMVASERAFAAATAEVGIRDGFLAFFAADSVKIKPGKPPTLGSGREALEAEPMSKLPVV